MPQIYRDKWTKTASLHVRGLEDSSERWALFAGPSFDRLEEHPIARGAGNGSFSLDVPATHRSYFRWDSEQKKTFLAERQLPMAGGYNIRDLGGFLTSSGRTVRWGRLFRADDLCDLTGEDLGYLAGIPITTIVDFRTSSEIHHSPDRHPASVRRKVALSIDPGNLMDYTTEGHDSEINPAFEMMKQLNVSLVTDQSCLERFREFFWLLQDESAAPLLFHCSAGKDRTGMAAALLLLGLGVDEETVLEDYFASNDYLDEKYGALKRRNPEIALLFEVRKEFLAAGLSRIRNDHGTVENFLENVLQVDLERLQSFYTAP